MTSRQDNRMAWGSDLQEQAARGDKEIFPDLHQYAGFGNVAVALTKEGLVTMDTSSRGDARLILKRLRAKTTLPIHTIIYTHAHGDHAGGGPVFMGDAEQRGDRPPRVIAHELAVKRFDRYKELGGLQLHMNMVQYGGAISAGENLDLKRPFLPPDTKYPNITFRDHMAFKLGELTFELHHSMGETDDNIWIFIPERNTVVAGDAVKAGIPNIGNPFKLLLRYELEWAEALEQIAGLKPDYVVQGHGPLLRGAAIQEHCLGQARFLRWVRGEVIDRMNRGQWLEQILEEVKMPPEMVGKPYLGEAYGCLNFVIHGIYYRYGGWYNGHPAEMFPANRQDIAAEVVHVGGADALVKRVRELRAEGKTPLALNLLDFVVDGEVSGAIRKEALQLRAELLDECAKQETNGMVKNTLLRGAEAADQEAKRL